MWLDAAPVALNQQKPGTHLLCGCSTGEKVQINEEQTPEVRTPAVRPGSPRRIHQVASAWRRYRAAHRLRRHARPDAILFVCEGNVYRSSFAAELLRSRLGSSAPDIESAGLVGSGRSVPTPAVAAAREHGADLRQHRSRLLTPDAVRAAEWIFVMEKGQYRGITGRFPEVAGRVFLLGDLDPVDRSDRTIDDPGGEKPEVLEEVFSRIERCVSRLVEIYRGSAADEVGVAAAPAPAAEG